MVPRLKQMTVAGTFDSGHYEYDSGLVLLHLETRAHLPLEGPTGVRLKAARPAPGAQRWPADWRQPMSGDLLIRDWTRRTAPGSPPCSWKNA